MTNQWKLIMERWHYDIFTGSGNTGNLRLGVDTFYLMLSLED